MTILATLKKKLSPMSDDDITGKLEALKDERRAFTRGHRSFRSDAHKVVAQRRAEITSSLDNRLSSPEVWMAPTDDLREMHALALMAADDAFWSRISFAVDAAPAELFSELSREDFDARVASLDREIGDLQTEQRRRIVEAAKDAALAAERELEASATR